MISTFVAGNEMVARWTDGASSIVVREPLNAGVGGVGAKGRVLRRLWRAAKGIVRATPYGAAADTALRAAKEARRALRGGRRRVPRGMAPPRSVALAPEDALRVARYVLALKIPPSVAVRVLRGLL